MSHSMGDQKVLINVFKGDQKVNNDNSTTISGGNVTGNQFAADSTEFKGVINNLSSPQHEKLNQLTTSLIDALKVENNQITGVNIEEVTDAVEQAKEAATKESVNKLTLNGLLTGIKMVMDDVKGISVATKQIYLDWHEEISTIFM